MNRLDLVVGCNGAGKSTFVELTLAPLLPRSAFVNADEIAKRRWPDDPAKHSYEAARIAAATRAELIERRESFIAETVFSHPSKLELVDTARAAGYTVIVHALLIPEHLAVLRVRHRVDAGGHDVPEQKIRERYRRLWGLVATAAARAHSATFYDNSARRGPRVVAQISGGFIVGSPAWPARTPPGTLHAMADGMTRWPRRSHLPHGCSVADVKLSPVAAAACLAALVMPLAACGSDSETPAASTSTTSEVSDVFTPPSLTQTAPEDAACPMVAPPDTAEPEWNLSGATGSIAVVGEADKAAPRIDVQAPFSVTETQVQTLKPGDGPVVADTATVLVCYMGVNGRDGSVFDSSYEQGAPVDFPLDGVVPGFQKAIAGQKVGSTVAVAMVPADGYPEGQPSAGIEPGDSLIFAIKILDATR